MPEGSCATLHTRPGTTVTTHIDKDGKELQFMPLFGAYAMTGRTFRKVDSKWVLNE
ncbi:hypothetical protein PLICRDRAFT_36089 [Plicaturopsis crispa FD-325 SS-3]|nr:hypothetical protein PLICRDRAFT_36089 [Plicaturopsis crispa FD-325 SS-3]